MEVSWAGGLPPYSCGLCNMHMNRGCLPELGAGTQSYSSFSEWEYIVCHYMLEMTNLFLDFTRCESQEIALSVRRDTGHLCCLVYYRL